MKQLIPPTSTVRSRMMKIMMMLPGVEQDKSDDDDCSVSVLPKPGEASSSDIEDYGPYWNDSSESMPYLDHLSD